MQSGVFERWLHEESLSHFLSSRAPPPLRVTVAWLQWMGNCLRPAMKRASAGSGSAAKRAKTPKGPEAGQVPRRDLRDGGLPHALSRGASESSAGRRKHSCRKRCLTVYRFPFQTLKRYRFTVSNTDSDQ